MKIAFAGSPEFAVTVLQNLVQSGKQIVAVLTQPDKPVGRKKVLTPTPVKAYAQEVGLPCYDWNKIREHVDELRALGADILITAAYGQLLTQPVLDSFAYGVWNIHGSLLPKYRGASPVQSAILCGEEQTGITVMKTELALDAGDMLLVKRLAIGNNTSGELMARLAELGAQAAVESVNLMEQTLAQMESSAAPEEFFMRLNLLMQDECGVTFCKKIKKEEAKIDWSQPASVILRQIKAYSPDPLAWCNLNGAPMNIFDANLVEIQGKAGEVLAADKKGIVVACGQGAISIVKAQPAGGKMLSCADLVNGRKIKVGDQLE